MNKLENFEYTLIKYNKKKYNTSLEIKIKGDDINYIIVNTIRRAILSYIPSRAFTEFNFKKNTSIFNNNYLKLHFKNIPVWGIENKMEIYNLDTKLDSVVEEENNNIDDMDFSDIDNNKLNISSLDQLTMYLDYTSNDKEIVSVTTDHAKFYFGQTNIKNPYENNQIQLIKLQPNQTIQFSAVTTIGTEEISSIYSVVSVCFYKQVNDNEFNFILESKIKSLSEKKIIELGIINIIHKLKYINKLIPTLDNNISKGEILIKNEDHTIGNLLVTGLQKHKKVIFAGYNQPHPLENNIKLHYELENNTIFIKNVINDVVEYYIELFEKIIKKNNLIKL